MQKQAVFALITVTFCLTGLPAAGATIYVDCSATGNNDGSSWPDAFNCLQDALAVARSRDRIYVAQGIYRPDQGAEVTPGDRTATFQLVNDVAIYGGFAGFSEPNPNTRDPNLYQTVLSGDLASNDVGDVYDPSRNENSYHVVTGSGTDETAVLDGFSITAGNANGLYRDAVGGGMYNYYAGPTLTNCTFTGNSADDNGGGVFNHESNPAVTNCTFVGNCAKAPADPQQYSKGGAIYNQSHSDPNLIKCTFTANSADGAHGYGGGVANDNSKPTLIGCKFSDNSATVGGAMANDNNAFPTLIMCAFSTNSATLGGGMANDDSSPTVTRSIFSANRAFYGGAMSNYRSSAKLTSCIFSGNSATYGAGMRDQYSSTRSYYCTFTGNLADSVGGIYDYRGNPTIANCILWENYPSQIYVYGGTADVAYCDVQGGWEGQGNIDTDPCFAYAGYWDANGLWVEGDYHLMLGSVCINAGDPIHAPERGERDFDGRPRMIRGRIDMGAYEFNHIPVADPGPSQQASYAWIDGMAQVTLDASRSHDGDDHRLLYRWSRLADGSTLTTTEAVSTVELPIGEHAYELVVTDGIEDSEPNRITITVVRPMSTYLRIGPRLIDRHSGPGRIVACVLLPEGITKDQIDCDQSNPPRLYPGGIEAATHRVIEYTSVETRRTIVLAFFSKSQLLDAIPPVKSMMKVQLVGQLRTGRYYYGGDVVEIIHWRWGGWPASHR